MSDLNSTTNFGASDQSEHSEASSNIFVNLAEMDSPTGIPSLRQAPASAISSSTSDSKLNLQLMIALCVLVVGAGAIYGMRYIGMKAGLDKQVVSIDYASETNSTEFAMRYRDVMLTLDESTIAVQLADKTEFAQRPFARPSAIKDEVVKLDPGMSEADRLELQRQRDLEFDRKRRHDSVISEAMRFQLQGVVGGSRPAARVSGQAVRAGMKLGEYFTVTEITGRSVIIEADGMRFELALGQSPVQLD